MVIGQDPRVPIRIFVTSQPALYGLTCSPHLAAPVTCVPTTLKTHAFRAGRAEARSDPQSPILLRCQPAASA